MIKYLLDTNIVIYTIKNRPDKVRRAVGVHAHQLGISAVTYSELAYGAMRSRYPQRNLADIEGFAANLDVLPFNENDATHGGDIRARLVERGRTMGAYDALIAGHARARGLILVTNNMNDFRSVPGLRLENWAR